MHAIDFLQVISSEFDACSYLPNQTARLPLSLPISGLTAEQFDQLLAAGYRRSGWLFYRTRCPGCSACEPLRLEVSKFRASESQRRAGKRGDRHLRVQVASPTIDERRLEIFNRHRSERQLCDSPSRVEESEYQSFLLNSYTQSIELSLWKEECLIAVSIADLGRESISAVYCFFDPDYAWLSPGTYAILRQIELAKSRGYRWLYLGLFVAANQHLRYKANYRPHQRLIDGVWRDC